MAQTILETFIAIPLNEKYTFYGTQRFVTVFTAASTMVPILSSSVIDVSYFCFKYVIYDRAYNLQL
jgi:hypothetical protein